VSSTRTSYVPRPDATPEAELDTLAACYRFILDSAKKRGRFPDKSGPDGQKGPKHDPATHQHTR
jgi:hypothetical protein